MKFKRSKPAEENDNIVTADNPVQLPTTESVKTTEFFEIAQKVMESHKNTLEKLNDNNYTENAYGVFKNKQNGQYFVVEISYDPLTNKANPDIVLIPVNDSEKSVGLERFQITVAQRLIDKVLYK